MADGDRGDVSPRDAEGQPAADDLDLRQFGH
jgi:hypothetical protein